VSMTVEKLATAIDEANRFIERAVAAKNSVDDGNWHDFDYTKTAAAKRSSMDLTRALAELRK